MASAELDQVTVEVENGQGTRLRATGSILAFDGFLKLYREDTDEAEEEAEGRMLPPMAERDPLDRGAVAASQHFTQPPPRYSEASLVKKLEELGIGRPSTYASILSVLRDRNYVRLESRRFIPEDRGRLVTAFLTSFFERYVDTGFTADLEEKLDDISGGRADWRAVMAAFWEEFSRAVDQTKDLKISDVIAALDEDLGPHFFPPKADGSDPRGCPACGNGRLGLKLGRYGSFIGCSNYPACQYTRRLAIENGEEAAADTLKEGMRVLGHHPETGEEITVRRGPYGLYVQQGEPQGQRETAPHLAAARGRGRQPDARTGDRPAVAAASGGDASRARRADRGRHRPVRSVCADGRGLCLARPRRRRAGGGAEPGRRCAGRKARVGAHARAAPKGRRAADGQARAVRALCAARLDGREPAARGGDGGADAGCGGGTARRTRQGAEAEGGQGRPQGARRGRRLRSRRPRRRARSPRRRRQPRRRPRPNRRRPASAGRPDKMRRFGVAAAVLLALALHGGDTLAQERGQPQSHAQAAIARATLPAAVSTEHTIALPGRTLRFTATAGSVPVGDQGQVQAEIGVIAYQLDGVDPRTRPVTFVLNGGPGFASAWLQLGGLGPWRLPMAGPADAPSATPAVQPNAETWLDFTDLVFIDPAGTGYSRIDAAAKGVRQHFWSVDGDIDSLSQTIRKWLDRNGRMLSPKFIAGESYGGFRAPRLVRALAQSEGVGIAGVVLISPSLDMSDGSQTFDPLFWAELLPTEIAIARAAHGPVTRAALADAEAYAGGEYLVDLVRGLSDQAVVARVSQRVAGLTGLDPALVRQHAGRIDPSTFQREIDRAQGRVASRFDGTVTIPDPFGTASFSRFPDPLLNGLEAPLSGAMAALYADRLHWHPDAQYRLFNGQANRQWDFGRGGRPQSMTALRTALALDPRFHAVVAAGLFDLVVPYFRTQMLLDTIAQTAGGDRVRFVVMPTGHMIYTRDESRAALRDAAEHLIEGQ